MDSAADLASLPTRSRPRAERVVLDVQISAGWLHSGYPIMGWVEGFRAVAEAVCGGAVQPAVCAAASDHQLPAAPVAASGLQVCRHCL